MNQNSEPKPQVEPVEGVSKHTHLAMKMKWFIRSIYESERIPVGVREVAAELIAEVERAGL